MNEIPLIDGRNDPSDIALSLAIAESEVTEDDEDESDY